ncbi:hypothetical protein ANCCAN_16146 [Ancylostoma caninum]|uniref:Uncharacterized protein n=1 Tax=Ancylostoma caninum TaxID=29170 RepID=A0A368G0E0_ANCCA|nr:hypothetical protein ANCCAN_16146 [Ancylostoma caninum]
MITPTGKSLDDVPDIEWWDSIVLESDRLSSCSTIALSLYKRLPMTRTRQHSHWQLI